jgi:hypothetical protein
MHTNKPRIVNDFSNQGCHPLFSLGIDIDIPDIVVVIHIGCPKYVISYWQEAGRCARDGRCGLSLIMYAYFYGIAEKHR